MINAKSRLQDLLAGQHAPAILLDRPRRAGRAAATGADLAGLPDDPAGLR